MAAAFLQTRGIDLHAELAKIQSTTSEASPTTTLLNASLPSTPTGSTWDLTLQDGRIQSITPFQTQPVQQSPTPNTILCNSALVTPSLCHPHIHLDKAYLLSHPFHSHLQISRGDFAEAMSLTSQAKSNFQREDLLERGQRVIDESVAAGVTHMRAFVELDAGVGFKCLEAGLQLKREAENEGRCVVQICAFAQLPLFSSAPGDEDGSVIRGLMDQAAGMEGVDVVGSTPYVESDRRKMAANVEWMVDLSLRHNLHLDLHLDYNLQKTVEPMVGFVVQTLKATGWGLQRKVMLGHCTRLTLFGEQEWRRLKEEIGELPISFVGLPTSDLFMMRTPERTRGTLDVPRVVREYGLNVCVGINNIGNAFTPHGGCDPLTLACGGVGIYQAGTKEDAELLYECISTRAREAIGLGRGGDGQKNRQDLELRVGDKADLVVFAAEKSQWRTRRTVSEAVYLYDSCSNRKGFLGGRHTG